MPERKPIFYDQERRIAGVRHWKFQDEIYTQRQPNQYSGDDVDAHLITWSH